MKLRSYLRGLGIGIIVTALLMGISLKKPEMSDEEIKAKAKQLGMVESTTLAEEAEKQLMQMEKENIETKENIENTVDKETEDMDKPSEEISENKENTPLEEKLEEELLGIRESGDDEENPAEENPAEVSKTEENPAEENNGEGENVENYTLEIKSGDSSVSVSKKLVQLGLITDANEYDKYLCANGYDKKICVGTYEINSGASYEEIAKIITKRN